MENRPENFRTEPQPQVFYYTEPQPLQPPVQPPRATLVLGYAGLTETQIGEAVKLLAQAWRN